MLEHRGIDSLAVMRASGLSRQQLMQPDNWPTLVRCALRLTHDPGLGLHFGTSLNSMSHGVFGYALMSCANLGDQLKLLIQYHHVLVPGAKVELVTQLDTIALRFEATFLEPDLERFYTEIFFASVRASGSLHFREVQNNTIQQFGYPAPQHLPLYHEVFGDNIEFQREASQLVIPERSLKLPISTANSTAEAMFREQCEALLKQSSDTAPISARVQQLLLHRPSDFPDIVWIASQLHMSESTLRRRLRLEGTGFQRLLDQVRFHLASQYLANTSLPIAKIGHLVGFDDVANFRQAFARWSGTTPSALRAELTKNS